VIRNAPPDARPAESAWAVLPAFFATAYDVDRSVLVVPTPMVGADFTAGRTLVVTGGS